MKRNKFSLSNYKIGSMNMGDLVPVGLTEVYPGDTFQHSTSAFIRVSPLNTPVMHPVHAKIYHFFVPHRLVWEDWEDFITGGPNGTDSSVFPTITTDNSSSWDVGSLADYLGIKPDISGAQVSALPFRGYALIWNEYFRDQDLQSETVFSTASGADTTTSKALLPGAWEKDYFTSARPWEQKGPAISIPLTGDAPVVTDGNIPNFTRTGSGTDQFSLRSSVTAQYGLVTDPLMPAGVAGVRFGNQTGLEADLDNVTAVDMNDLRLAMALQRYEEARARWGSRYVEYLAYLGVKSSDARLQRPEYLGGGKQTIQFSEVLQTSPDTEGLGVGDLYGHGIGVAKSNRYRRFFEEHGYVFSFMIVRPVAVYADGVDRHWLYRSKEDFWQKELEHVGQQAIKKAEVYLGSAQPDGTFAYQDRYDHLRRARNTISGEMRTLLDTWHMARLFSSEPSLNAAFIRCEPTDRIYQSTDTDELYFMVRHSLQARRMIAKTGSSFIY